MESDGKEYGMKGYTRREVWSKGLTTDLLIGTYETRTDEQARQCALLTIRRENIRYIASLYVLPELPQAASVASVTR